MIMKKTEVPTKVVARAPYLNHAFKCFRLRIRDVAKEVKKDLSHERLCTFKVNEIHCSHDRYGWWGN